MTWIDFGNLPDRHLGPPLTGRPGGERHRRSAEAEQRRQRVDARGLHSTVGPNQYTN